MSVLAGNLSLFCLYRSFSKLNRTLRCDVYVTSQFVFRPCNCDLMWINEHEEGNDYRRNLRCSRSVHLLKFSAGWLAHEKYFLWVGPTVLPFWGGKGGSDAAFQFLECFWKERERIWRQAIALIGWMDWIDEGQHAKLPGCCTRSAQEGIAKGKEGRGGQ